MRRQAVWQEIIKTKGGCCQRCGGIFHPAVYELHHPNPAEKKLDIAKHLSVKLTDDVWNEIMACELLCANCHRTVQYGEEDLSRYWVDH
jgi:hypothetical protein